MTSSEGGTYLPDSWEGEVDSCPLCCASGTGKMSCLWKERITLSGENSVCQAGLIGSLASYQSLAKSAVDFGRRVPDFVWEMCQQHSIPQEVLCRGEQMLIGCCKQSLEYLKNNLVLLKWAPSAAFLEGEVTDRGIYWSNEWASYERLSKACRKIFSALWHDMAPGLNFIFIRYLTHQSHNFPGT